MQIWREHARMFSGVLSPACQDSKGRFFIDRDGSRFATVLAFLWGEPLNIPTCSKERVAISAEASFFQVSLYLLHVSAL